MHLPMIKKNKLIYPSFHPSIHPSIHPNDSYLNACFLKFWMTLSGVSLFSLVFWYFSKTSIRHIILLSSILNIWPRFLYFSQCKGSHTSFHAVQSARLVPDPRRRPIAYSNPGPHTQSGRKRRSNEEPRGSGYQSDAWHHVNGHLFMLL